MYMLLVAANNNKTTVGRCTSVGSPTRLSKDEGFHSGVDNVIYSNSEPGKNILHCLRNVHCESKKTNDIIRS